MNTDRLFDEYFAKLPKHPEIPIVSAMVLDPGNRQISIGKAEQPTPGQIRSYWPQEQFSQDVLRDSAVSLRISNGDVFRLLSMKRCPAQHSYIHYEFECEKVG